MFLQLSGFKMGAPLYSPVIWPNTLSFSSFLMNKLQSNPFLFFWWMSPNLSTIIRGFSSLYLIPARGLSQVAQLVRASYQYTKVVGLIPKQGTYKNHPTNA